MLLLSSSSGVKEPGRDTPQILNAYAACVIKKVKRVNVLMKKVDARPRISGDKNVCRSLSSLEEWYSKPFSWRFLSGRLSSRTLGIRRLRRFI